MKNEEKEALSGSTSSEGTDSRSRGGHGSIIVCVGRSRGGGGRRRWPEVEKSREGKYGADVCSGSRAEFPPRRSLATLFGTLFITY